MVEAGKAGVDMRGDHTKARREADATLPTSAEAKAALLYVYSHANTGS